MFSNLCTWSELGDIHEARGSAAAVATLLTKAQHERAEVRQAAVEALAAAAPRGQEQVVSEYTVTLYLLLSRRGMGYAMA